MSTEPNPAPPSAPASVVYGMPSPELVEAGADALQTSPLIPGAAALEALAPNSVDRAVIAAPPGTLERRYVQALALRALKPGGELVVLAPKDRGGARLKGELTGFGCEVEETGRRHQRICRSLRPALPVGLDAAIAAGGPQRLDRLDLWTQPGVFSWDRPDPGTELLIQHLPGFSGAGADLGCGLGQIARAVLASPAVTELTLVDADAVPPALMAELSEAESRVLLARRFHNDAVRDTLALRERRPVRWLKLGGRAPLQTYFEIAELAQR